MELTDLEITFYTITTIFIGLAFLGATIVILKDRRSNKKIKVI